MVRNVLEISPKGSGGTRDVIFVKLVRDFLPNFLRIPNDRPVIDGSFPILNGGLPCYQLFGLHMLEPDGVVSGHDELGVWKFGIH